MFIILCLCVGVNFDVYLFGWDNGKVNMEEVNVCVEKLDALDDIENYDAYEWLKREAGK